MQGRCMMTDVSAPTSTPTSARDIAAHECWFDAFTAPYLEEGPEHLGPVRLKIDHTHHVLTNARAIVDSEDFSPLVQRAALLAALYHDTGRFPQYRRWRTFSDPRSVNHALLGGRTLREAGALDGESAEVRRLVLGAVVMHNRFRVPSGISTDARTVTDVVRDADKLDIFRVMAPHLAPGAPRDSVVVLHVEDAPGKWSPVIVADVLAGRVASYADLRYVNDFRLLLGTWVRDLRFSASRRMLAASGLVENILSGLPISDDIEQARARILSDLAAATQGRDVA